VRLAKDPFLPRVLASIITILLSIGVFIVATARNGTPLGNYDLGIGDHWQPQDRGLTIIDRTDDPAWHQAIVAAVATWAAGGSALRLTLISGSGSCAQRRDQIQVCQAGAAELTKEGSDQDQGLFLPKVGLTHDYRSSILLVCSACVIDHTRMIVVATHELGHALGLAHNPDPFSVMYFQGGSTQPDAYDFQVLRQLEGAAPMRE
jgi:hypothetical protein